MPRQDSGGGGGDVHPYDDPYPAVRGMISGNAVLVVGAGPSLDGAIAALSRNGGALAGGATIMAADTAVAPLVRACIIPDIITTDLDGDVESQAEASRRGAVIIVHAHGDNPHLLHHAGRFARCMGTTQAEPQGLTRNLGGFTDGDRAVFIAHRLGARLIILLGMDFGRTAGRHSRTPESERDIKIRKMEAGRSMLEAWFARGGAAPTDGVGNSGDGAAGCRLFTTSGSIRGFAPITYDGVSALLRQQQQSRGRGRARQPEE